VKVALFLCAFGLVFAEQSPDREGNFDIRIEPTAKVQTGVQVPFQIKVNDSLNKPVFDAKVTMRIENANHTETQTFKAPAINPGVYVAKPVFPAAGDWTASVEVRRSDQVSTRSISVAVSD